MARAQPAVLSRHLYIYQDGVRTVKGANGLNQPLRNLVKHVLELEGRHEALAM